MKGLVLSGGTGSRLRPITHTAAKQLIPIANKPILFRAIEDLADAGITDIGVVVGDTKKEIKDALGNGSQFGVKVTYIEQNEPRGLAHAVAISEDFLGKSAFVMYLGDNVLKNGVADFIESFEESDEDVRILLTRIAHPERFGVVELKGKRVVGLEEKPKKPKSDLALVGVYMFKPPIFEAVKKIKPSWRNELEITDALQELLNSRHHIEAKIVSGWWKDTGRPEDILEANRLVLEDLKPFNRGKIEGGAEIHGRVGIDEGSTIKRGSVVRGPVIIGKNCEIGPDTYIGPYTSIGDGSLIKDGELEGSVVIGGAKIECGKRIVDSLIGRNCTIISTENTLPKGYKFVIGENSCLGI